MPVWTKGIDNQIILMLNGPVLNWCRTLCTPRSHIELLTHHCVTLECRSCVYRRWSLFKFCAVKSIRSYCALFHMNVEVISLYFIMSTESECFLYLTDVLTVGIQNIMVILLLHLSPICNYSSSEFILHERCRFKNKKGGRLLPSLLWLLWYLRKLTLYLKYSK